MTPAESWLLVLCWVLPAGAMAGLIVWLAWSFRGDRKVSTYDEIVSEQKRGKR